MSVNYELCLSIITVIVSVVALSQTSHQIKLSNKQHLFDKRIENYLIATGLVQLWRNNSSYFNEKNLNSLPSFELLFKYLTNNTFLQEITPAIDYPQKQPYHNTFLIMLEGIKEVAIKIEFLFRGNEASALKNFIISYQDLLFALYQHEIIFRLMRQHAQEHQEPIEAEQNRYSEPEYRGEIQNMVKALTIAYQTLENMNVEEKIKKQIELN